MVTIDDSLECYRHLWTQLEATRQGLDGEYRRFCLRAVIHEWVRQGIIALPPTPEGEPPPIDERHAIDDFVWRVVRLTAACGTFYDGYSEGEIILGLDELPPPSQSPLKHRAILIALCSLLTGKGRNRLHLSHLDKAYSQVFPDSTPIDTWKKGWVT